MNDDERELSSSSDSNSSNFNSPCVTIEKRKKMNLVVKKVGKGPINAPNAQNFFLTTLSNGTNTI